MHMERKHTLIDNAAEKRYELDLGDGMALAEYVLGHGLIVLTHTEVPPKYEGRGIGKELVPVSYTHLTLPTKA